MLTKLIHVHEWLGLRHDYLLDFNLAHWGFSWRELGLTGLLKVLLGRSPISDGHDNAAYDATVRAMAHHNAAIREDEATFYRSYASSTVRQDAAPRRGRRAAHTEILGAARRAPRSRTATTRLGHPHRCF